MENKIINGIFEKEIIESINEMIEDKIYILQNNKEFKQLDDKLLNDLEKFESLISKKLKNQFDDIMKLIYQTEEYYFLLAYSLGVKYGNNINNI